MTELLASRSAGSEGGQGEDLRPCTAVATVYSPCTRVTGAPGEVQPTDWLALPGVRPRASQMAPIRLQTAVFERSLTCCRAAGTSQ